VITNSIEDVAVGLGASAHEQGIAGVRRICGIVSVRKLDASRCRQVPAEPGVYAVVRPSMAPPRFRTQSTGGRFKGKDPTVAKEILAGRWVDTDVLYLGRSRPPLRGRILDLVDYGSGGPAAHQGGRYLWQLQGSDDFLVAWKPTPDPVREEIFLQAPSSTPTTRCPLQI